MVGVRMILGEYILLVASTGFGEFGGFYLAWRLRRWGDIGEYYSDNDPIRVKIPI